MMLARRISLRRRGACWMGVSACALIDFAEGWLRVVSGDVFVFSPFESVTACEGSRVRVLACVCSGVDSDAGVVAESGATVYAGDGVTVSAESGSLVYAEDGSCVRLLDVGVKVFASAGALVLYGSRSELALVQGGAHVKRTLTYGVAQWLDESGVVVDDDLNVRLYAAVDGETGLWCGPYDGESAFLLPCADMWEMTGVGVEVVPVTIPAGLLHPVVAKWPRADWAVVSACVNGESGWRCWVCGGFSGSWPCVRRVLVSDASPVLLWYSRRCPLFYCRRFRAVSAWG